MMQGSPSQDCNENPVIIESLFKETTRNGKHTLRLVLVGKSLKNGSDYMLYIYKSSFAAQSR